MFPGYPTDRTVETPARDLWRKRPPCTRVNKGLAVGSFSRPRAVREEILQHRHEYLRGHDVLLVLQDLVPSVWQGNRELSAYVDHPRRARPAGEDEGGCRRCAGHVGRYRATPADIAHHLGVVGHRRRHGLQLRPPRGLAHLIHHLLRHPDGPPEVLERVVAAVFCQQGPDVFGFLARSVLPVLVALGVVGRLVQDELGNRQTRGSRTEGEGGAGGVSVHRSRPSGLGDQRADVFDLPLESVRGGVAAVAPAPAVVVEHGEALGQFLGRRTGQSRVAQLPAHHDNRWTVAQPIEGDRGAVTRSHRFHGVALLPRPVAHARLLEAYGNGLGVHHRFEFWRKYGGMVAVARRGRPCHSMGATTRFSCATSQNLPSTHSGEEARLVRTRPRTRATRAPSCSTSYRWPASA